MNEANSEIEMHGSGPLISVVIPSYNRSLYVGEAIESALQQQGCRVEVIVIDDGSLDDTQPVLQSFGTSIRVVTKEVNVGPAAARNAGAAVARGEILAFLDADDLWEPDKLRAQLSTAISGVPSVTGIRLIDSSGSFLGRSYTPPADASERLLYSNVLVGSGSTLVLPRDLFLGLDGFPERPRGIAEDWLFSIKLVKRGHRIQSVPQPLAKIRVHGDNYFTRDASSIERALWSSVDWIAANRLATGGEITRLRARGARVIARSFANQGRWKDAWSWAKTSATYRKSATDLAKLLLVPLSGARGFLRRIRD